ncbi:hypothetical protein A3Q56_06457 [Intoshia linei]|uniref:Uncharacterized protein n=1 Tax=Intoshia linei TaxID=1819745 RepID=A0A177AUV8_9BILA|nr:hypothetical protein A3Q56_06457 [Intoshia linei]
MEEFINESNNSKYIKTLSVDKYYEYYERLIKLQNNVNEPRIKNDWNILNKYELIAEGDLKYIVKKRTMKKVLNIEDTYIEISDYHINSGHSGHIHKCNTDDSFFCSRHNEWTFWRQYGIGFN